MKKRLTASVLFMAILLAGCGGTGAADTTAADETDGQVTDSAPRDGLPEDLDFGGKEVKIHTGLWMGVTADPLAEIYVEEATGDVVDDAVYNRNRAVENRLNVSLSFDWHETTWQGRQTELDYINSSIMAGDDAFDLVVWIAHLLPSIAVGGSMHNLTDMKYLNLSSPWWAGLYNDTATVDDTLYFALGDITTNYYLHSYCMYFNQNLINDMKLENPYELVESGTWTLDKLRSMAAASYGDLNGNSTPDDTDRWGAVIQGGNIISGFMEASNVKVFEASDSKEKFDYIYGSEHNIEVVQKMCSLLHESEGVLLSFEGNNAEYLFTGGNTVFSGGWFGDTDFYRDLDFDFGIIPYPKYDEAQEDYYTRIGTGASVAAIPVTTKDPDMVSAVLEVMAAEGYYQMRPAYFDAALKNKYSRDETTKDMVDRIISSVAVDFGNIYTYSLNSIGDKFKLSIRDNKPEWASQTESWKPTVMESLDKLLTAING